MTASSARKRTGICGYVLGIGVNELGTSQCSQIVSDLPSKVDFEGNVLDPKKVCDKLTLCHHCTSDDTWVSLSYI